MTNYMLGRPVKTATDRRRAADRYARLVAAVPDAKLWDRARRGADLLITATGDAGSSITVKDFAPGRLRLSLGEHAATPLVYYGTENDDRPVQGLATFRSEAVPTRTASAALVAMTMCMAWAATTR